jgi:hypothetical protein
MLKRTTSLFIFCIILVATGCHRQVKARKITYVAVSDSTYDPDSNYTRNFSQWKKIYEECIKHQLFANAFYMGLQGKLNVGSITNISGQSVNGKISVLDTTHVKNIFSILSPLMISNCYSKIDLDNDLQNDFHSELGKILAQSKEYNYLNDLMDTTQMTFGITTLSDNAIVPDSLLSLLQRSTDTSLVEFKKLLLTPGNVLLTRDAIIFGFYSEFPLKTRLSAADENKFSREQFFTFGNPGETGSIKLLSNGHLQVLINKYYTVFGEFYSFKEVED